MRWWGLPLLGCKVAVCTDIAFLRLPSRYLRCVWFALGFALIDLSSGFRIGLGLLVRYLGLGWACLVHALGLWCVGLGVDVVGFGFAFSLAWTVFGFAWAHCG